MYIRKIAIVAMQSGDVNKQLGICLPSIREQSQESTVNITSDTLTHLKKLFLTENFHN